MRITAMLSPNGNPVPNQYEIWHNGAVYFQSYESIIAMKKAGRVYLDSYYWDYSTTTGKYRNIFLSEKKPDTEKKIQSGEYILTDLQEELK
jgi:hypothetical protein